MAATARRTVGSVVAPGEAGAFHLCGHTYTTGSCPHPTGMPRIDSRGFPLRDRDGRPVDDVGRPVDDAGQPVDDHGQPAPRPRRPPAAARAPHAGLRHAVQRSTASGRRWTAPGTAAAAARSAS